MKRVLKETGSIYLHMDYRLVHYLKVEMDKIFGINNFINEIIWQYSGGGVPKDRFAPKHDNILLYKKGKEWTFNAEEIRTEYSESTKKRFSGTINNIRNGINFGEQTLNEKGKYPESVINLPILAPSSNERLDYATQKPKVLIEKFIKASSNKGDIVADFFMGSGTTGEVALELGRKFIGCDIGEKACEITKNRLDKIII